MVGLGGLEPPTSRLSGVRSNQLSYNPIGFGSHLSSHAVSGIVFSAVRVLTVVFGMGTGVSPGRIATKCVLLNYWFLRISHSCHHLACRLDGVSRSMHPRPLLPCRASTPAPKILVCADAP